MHNEIEGKDFLELNDCGKHDSNKKKVIGIDEECSRLFYTFAGCRRPFFRSIFMLYCQLTPETNVKTLCLRHNPRAIGIDERYIFIVFNTVLIRIVE